MILEIIKYMKYGLQPGYILGTLGELCMSCYISRLSRQNRATPIHGMESSQQFKPGLEHKCVKSSEYWQLSNKNKEEERMGGQNSDFNSLSSMIRTFLIKNPVKIDYITNRLTKMWELFVGKRRWHPCCSSFAIGAKVISQIQRPESWFCSWFYFGHI